MAKAPLNISKKRPRSTRPLFVPDVNELKRRMGKSGSVVVADAPKVETAPLKLRFGTHEEEGYVKMVPTWDDEVVVSPPWHLPGTSKSIASESVEAIFFAFYYHRLTPSQRFAALDEAYRVLKPGAQIMIVSPYWSSRRAVADPLAVWPPVCEESFYVYSKAWRENDGLDKVLPLKCDFAAMTPQGQLIVPAGHIPDPEVAQRNDEYRQHASRHFVNAVWELHVTLTKVAQDG
jgi:SAM-dependent methyltransferase